MIQVLLLLGALAWSPAFAGEGEEEPPYNVHQNPIDNRHFGILFKNGYEVRPDGTVWAKGGAAPIGRSELTFLVDHLVSTQRLKALLQLNLILSKSQGEKKLKPAEKEEIRSIVKENWGVFTISTRKDFRGYFSIEELESLNAVAPLFSAGSGVPLKSGRTPLLPDEWPAMAAAPLMLPGAWPNPSRPLPRAPEGSARSPRPSPRGPRLRPRRRCANQGAGKSPAVSGVEEAPFAFHPGCQPDPEGRALLPGQDRPPPAITRRQRPAPRCSLGGTSKADRPSSPEKAPPRPRPGPAPAAHTGPRSRRIRPHFR